MSLSIAAPKELMNLEDMIKPSEPQTAIWVPIEFYDKLLRLRETDPKAWEMMSPQSRLTCLQYEANKRKFESLNETDNDLKAA